MTAGKHPLGSAQRPELNPRVALSCCCPSLLHIIWNQRVVHSRVYSRAFLCLCWCIAVCFGSLPPLVFHWRCKELLAEMRNNVPMPKHQGSTFYKFLLLAAALQTFEAGSNGYRACGRFVKTGASADGWRVGHAQGVMTRELSGVTGSYEAADLSSQRGTDSSCRESSRLTGGIQTYSPLGLHPPALLCLSRLHCSHVAQI